MDITESKVSEIVIFGLKGRLDTTTAQSAQEKLLASIGGGEKHLAIDCVQLEYISSAGLRALLLAAKQLRAVNGKIVLYGLKEHIKEVFDLAGFSAAFPIFHSQVEALNSFKS
jgi:anti-sigma B factor antagonist